MPIMALPSTPPSEWTPHDYWPDYQMMGDCIVCGHTRESSKGRRHMNAEQRLFVLINAMREIMVTAGGALVEVGVPVEQLPLNVRNAKIAHAAQHLHDVIAELAGSDDDALLKITVSGNDAAGLVLAAFQELKWTLRQ